MKTYWICSSTDWDDIRSYADEIMKKYHGQIVWLDVRFVRSTDGELVAILVPQKSFEVLKSEFG